MSGDEMLEAYVIGAATASILFLSWYLLGPELTIIFGLSTVLGIALSHTPSRKDEQEHSPRTLRRSRSLRSRSVSATTTRGAYVTPDSVELSPLLRRRPSKHLAAVQRSISFDEDL